MEYIAIFALFALILIAFYRAEKAQQERDKLLKIRIQNIESRIQKAEKELVRLVNQ